jgi:hypothetical protein
MVSYVRYSGFGRSGAAWSAGLVRAGLRPELVPGVKVIEVLPNLNDPAAL